MSARSALLLSFSFVVGCSASAFPLVERAAEEGLQHVELSTSYFEHSTYRKSGDSEYQVVFIEGDGRPWNSGGLAPSADPTPVDALAFELMLATPADAVYITRPCYFGTWSESCSPRTWTSGRFSLDVVNSLSEAVRMSTEPDRPVILVGYSGGGALALLASEELDGVVGIVTVAGLLDIDTWTDHHGYDRLSGSINPASRSPSVRGLHLHGALDEVIPIALVRDALADVQDAELKVFDAYGHVCCWRRDWPRIWRDVESALGLDERGIESYEQSDSRSASQ